MKRLIALVFAILPSLAGAEPPAGSEPDFLSEAGRWKQVYIAGQPTAADLAQARDAGVSVVINARGPGEMTFDEAAAAREAGLAYYNVPLSRNGNDTEAFARISELIAANEGKEVLVHCGSGNRVAGWLATHLVNEEGESVNSALKTARKTGLTSDGLALRVRTYLEAEAD